MNDRHTLTRWSWENKQPERDPDAPRTLWRIDSDSSVKDPRRAGAEDWADCEVLAYTARIIGMAVALIRTDRLSADRLRGRRGIRTVEPAPDGRYLDDDSATVVIVSREGTQWERVVA
jgi:hypothetical protein